MRGYSIEPRTREYVKCFGFLPFVRNLYNKYGKMFWIVLQKQHQMLQNLLSKK